MKYGAIAVRANETVTFTAMPYSTVLTAIIKISYTIHTSNRNYKFCKLCSYQHYYTKKRTCHASKYWYDRRTAKENAVI